MTIHEIVRNRDPFSIKGLGLFSRRYAPNAPPEAAEPPVCSLHERCKGCPYPSHGFVCWRKDGACMRTDVGKIIRKEQNHASDHL